MRVAVLRVPVLASEASLLCTTLDAIHHASCYIPVAIGGFLAMYHASCYEPVAMYYVPVAIKGFLAVYHASCYEPVAMYYLCTSCYQRLPCYVPR